MTKEELDKLIADGLAVSGKPGRPVGSKTTGLVKSGRRSAPTGSTRAARLRWIHKHRPDVFEALVNGKYTKIRARDGAVLYDLPAAEEAAGRRMSSKCVYLIQASGTSRYKIGWGKHLATRIDKIKNASPFPIVEIVAVRSDNPKELESKLHTMFSAKRVWREWFELDDMDIDKIKSM